MSEISESILIWFTLIPIQLKVTSLKLVFWSIRQAYTIHQWAMTILQLLSSSLNIIWPTFMFRKLAFWPRKILVTNSRKWPSTFSSCSNLVTDSKELFEKYVLGRFSVEFIRAKMSCFHCTRFRLTYAWMIGCKSKFWNRHVIFHSNIEHFVLIKLKQWTRNMIFIANLNLTSFPK